MATDLRDGKAFPRRGRDEYGGCLWLLRVFDKARAFADGTIFDYIYPCPMDRGVFERWGITADDFNAAIKTCRTDDEILAWVKSHVSEEKREAANTYLLTERMANLEKQDVEEGVVAA
jgi:hypothetical protein